MQPYDEPAMVGWVWLIIVVLVLGAVSALLWCGQEGSRPQAVRGRRAPGRRLQAGGPGEIDRHTNLEKPRDQPNRAGGEVTERAGVTRLGPGHVGARTSLRLTPCKRAARVRVVRTVSSG